MKAKPKNKPSAKLEEAKKTIEYLTKTAKAFSMDAHFAQTALCRLELRHNELKAKHTRALLDLQATLNERTRAEIRLAEAEVDLLAERKAHQATKSLGRAGAFVSGIIGAAVAFVSMLATR